MQWHRRANAQRIAGDQLTAMSNDALSNWDGVRDAWLKRADLSLAAIARAHGLTPGRIRYRANRDGWGPRAGLVAASAASGAARPMRVAQQRGFDERADTIAVRPRRTMTRAELIERIYVLLERELALIEARVALMEADPALVGKGDGSGMNDFIGKLQKLGTIDESAAPASEQPARDGAQGSDINRLRRELVERIARLRAEWRERMGRKPAE